MNATITRYFRFGRLPEDSGRDYYGTALGLRSTNHRDGTLEDGVSVYPGNLDGDTLILDLRGIDALSGILLMAGRPVFEVTGEPATPSDLTFDYDAIDEDGSRGAWVTRSALGADGEPLLRGDIAAVAIHPTTILARLTEAGDPIRIR